MVVATIIAAAAGWITAPRGVEPDRFSAQSILVFNNLSTVGGVNLDPLSPDLAAQFLKVGEVPRRVATSIGFLGEPEVLAARLSVRPNARDSTVTLSATFLVPEEAVGVVNAFNTELMAWDVDRNRDRIQGERDRRVENANSMAERIINLDDAIAASAVRSEQVTLTGQRETLARQYDSLTLQIRQMDEFLEGTRSRIEVALPPSAQRVVPAGFTTPRSPAVRAGLGGLLGLAVGAALALFLHRSDQRVQNRGEAEAAFQFQVIGEVPEAEPDDRANFRVLTFERPRAPLAEAYRSLRTALSLMPVIAGTDSGTNGHRRTLSGDVTPKVDAGHGKVIVVTSPGPAEGKTSTVANLAASWAETGASVLVVSGDTRRPMLHNYLKVENGPGLTDAIKEGLDTAGLARLVRRTGIPGVYMLSSGTELVNPGAILHAEHDVMLACRRMANIVIIDTPPILVANDALELMVRADAVVVLARVGRTTSEAARRAAELMLRVGAPVVGAALIGSTPISSYYGYYGYYGRYGNDANGRGGRAEGNRSGRPHGRSRRSEPGRHSPPAPQAARRPKR